MAINHYVNKAGSEATGVSRKWAQCSSIRAPQDGVRFGRRDYEKNHSASSITVLQEE